MPKRWRNFLFIGLLFSCGYTSTEELLEGKGLGFSSKLPEILSPRPESLFLLPQKSEITITWEKLTFDRYYEITIAKDQNFENILAGFPVKVFTNTFVFSIKEPINYYVRLRSEFSPVGEYSYTYFYATDAVYVACTTSCDAKEHIGNQSDPYQNISLAMAKASAMGMEVRIANTTTYNETLFLQAGVSLRGGYTLPNWTQNLNQKTKISANYAPIMSCLAQKPSITTVIEGFDLESTATGADLATVYFESCENFVFRQNSVQSPQNTTVKSMGLYSLNSKIKLEKNFIGGQNQNQASEVRAVWLSNNQSEILANQVLGTRNNGHGIAIYEEYGENRFMNNLILGGYNNQNYGTLYGVYSSNTNSKFLHNTIGGGRAVSTNTKAFAFFVWADFPLVLENNLLFTTQATSRYCFAEGNANLTLLQLKNNNFFDCPNGLYVGHETPYNCEWGSRHCYTQICTDGLPGDVSGCANGVNVLPSGAFSGNTNLGSASSLFVSVNGADNNLITMGDNNWSLKPAVVSLCNVLFGGKTPVLEVSWDFVGVERTPVIPSSGTCAGNVTNVNAIGLSMGAYEQDN